MGVKVLSLFDGMACGMLAMISAGLDVEKYVAYEIDKYAVKTSSHNFPMIEHMGDVFKADFTEYEGFDWLVGGSPCTYWSIAQTKNRETEASGLGWELFSQYVRALHEAKPKYFIYENNKSMSAAIRESITKTFGFEPICINSALVSAQNRQRLYWVGIRQADGTYKKCNVEQPQDRGILLNDVLETNAKSWQDKAYTYTTRCQGAIVENTLLKHQHTMVAMPINVMQCGIESVNDTDAGVVAMLDMKGQETIRRVYGTNGKSPTITTCVGGHRQPKVFENIENLIVKEATKKGYTEIRGGDCVDMSMLNSKTRRGRNMNKKSNCLQTSCSFYQYCGTVDTPIYEVKDGMITVKDKQYPIKLMDGYYIIRKLTVLECMRLQTIPEWYAFPVSNSQAYKMLGNGWTVEVIAHLIKSIMKEVND